MPPYVGPELQAAYYATVQSRDTTGRWWVTLDGVAGLRAATILESWGWPNVATGAASTGTAHTHGPGHPLQHQDRVLVLVVAGNIDQLIIVGRLTQ